MKNLLKKHKADYIAEKKDCYIFTVKEKTDNPDAELIPKKINGKPTEVIEADLKALSTPEERQQQTDTLKGGISIGNVFAGRGTLGIVLYYDGEPAIYTNAHVGAQHWQGSEIGHPIIQPGFNDGSFNQVASLVDYQKISFTDENLVDGCVALIHDEYDYKPLYIEGIGDINPKVRRMEEGDEMYQSGASTGPQKEEVVATEGVFKVTIGGEETFWEDQVLLKNCKDYAIPGDSGSVIIHENKDIGGCIFGGGDKYVVANQFDNAMKAFPKLSLTNDMYVALNRDWMTDTEIKVNNLNVRSTPEIADNIVRQFNKGQKITIKGYAGYKDGWHWIQCQIKD